MSRNKLDSMAQKTALDTLVFKHLDGQEEDTIIKLERVHITLQTGHNIILKDLVYIRTKKGHIKKTIDSMTQKTNT